MNATTTKILTLLIGDTGATRQAGRYARGMISDLGTARSSTYKSLRGLIDDGLVATWRCRPADALRYRITPAGIRAHYDAQLEAMGERWAKEDEEIEAMSRRLKRARERAAERRAEYREERQEVSPLPVAFATTCAAFVLWAATWVGTTASPARVAQEIEIATRNHDGDVRQYQAPYQRACDAERDLWGLVPAPLND